MPLSCRCFSLATPSCFRLNCRYVVRAERPTMTIMGVTQVRFVHFLRLESRNNSELPGGGSPSELCRRFNSFERHMYTPGRGSIERFQLSVHRGLRRNDPRMNLPVIRMSLGFHRHCASRRLFFSQ